MRNENNMENQNSASNTHQFDYTVDLMMLYKTMWFHSLNTTPKHKIRIGQRLKDLENVKQRFFEQIGNSREATFMDFNLTSLNAKDIAMRNCMYRPVDCKGPPAVWWFVRKPDPHDNDINVNCDMSHMSNRSMNTWRDLGIMRNTDS